MSNKEPLVPRTGLDAEQIRERAVALAEDQLRLFGIERMRLADVARGLGIAHSSLYKHFPDKATLFAMVSEKWTTHLDQTLATIAEADGSPPKLIVDWFIKLHRLKRERVLGEPELYRAFLLAVEARQPFVTAHLQTLQEQLSGLIRKGIDVGDFRRGSAETYTRFLFEATRGFVHPALVLQFSDRDRKAELKETLQMAFRALAADEK
jgi:AcrR family transcriptional regulator